VTTPEPVIELRDRATCSWPEARIAAVRRTPDNLRDRDRAEAQVRCWCGSAPTLANDPEGLA
jgi:hypothetical protein